MKYHRLNFFLFCFITTLRAMDDTSYAYPENSHDCDLFVFNHCKDNDIPALADRLLNAPSHAIASIVKLMLLKKNGRELKTYFKNKLDPENQLFVQPNDNALTSKAKLLWAQWQLNEAQCQAMRNLQAIYTHIDNHEYSVKDSVAHTMECQHPWTSPDENPERCRHRDQNIAVCSLERASNLYGIQFGISPAIRSFLMSTHGRYVLIKLTYDTLREFRELESLTVENAPLLIIEPDAFEHNTKLKRIKLLSSMPNNQQSKALKSLGQLEELTIIRCPIHFIGKNEFHNQTQRTLKSLTLRKVGLEYVPKELLAHFKNLEHLDLNGNQITLIPPCAFEHNTNLKDLNISENPIAHFANSVFVNLDNLTRLSIDAHALSKLDEEEFDYLSDLKTICILSPSQSSDSTHQYETLQKRNIKIYSLSPINASGSLEREKILSAHDERFLPLGD